MFSNIDLFQFYFFEYKLQGIAIDERVLMMWKKYTDGVPDVIIDNKNILFEGVGNAALRLRRRFMRTGYVPRMCENLQQIYHQNLKIRFVF